MSTLKPQVACLVNTRDGWQYMDCYDDFPRPIRERLSNSPYNLCAACVRDGASWMADDEPNADHYMARIREMEWLLRKEQS